MPLRWVCAKSWVTVVLFRTTCVCELLNGVIEILQSL